MAGETLFEWFRGKGKQKTLPIEPEKIEKTIQKTVPNNSSEYPNFPKAYIEHEVLGDPREFSVVIGPFDKVVYIKNRLKTYKLRSEISNPNNHLHYYEFQNDDSTPEEIAKAAQVAESLNNRNIKKIANTLSGFLIK